MQDNNELVLYRIEQLLRYGLANALLEHQDIDYCRNALLYLFKCDEPLAKKIQDVEDEAIGIIMSDLIDYGYQIGLIEHNSLSYRDLLDARIMGLLLPRPSQFIESFNCIAEQDGIKEATQYFYDFSIASRYIRMDRVNQNPSWLHDTSFGTLQLTINLAKPEKDPVEIAKLKALTPAHYPSCLLCKENEGYSGRLDHPARQHLRVLPLELSEETWYLQYSPYTYYNEHSIVFSHEHKPMKISKQTFQNLLDFVEQFPHYFIGANADLPIVGGSILNHDHYQAGCYKFPMEMAKVIESYSSPQYPAVSVSRLAWPLSFLRLQSVSKEKIIEVAVLILEEWKQYSDELHDIKAHTIDVSGELVPHNTITPIARMKEEGLFELDIVLRNNRTTDKYPYGIFHPPEYLHHIKKENIGLIEVMGLAILPARLKVELQEIATLLEEGNAEAIQATAQPNHPLYLHSFWIDSLVTQYGHLNAPPKAMDYVLDMTGQQFLDVLRYAGVFKSNTVGEVAFESFIKKIGFL